MSEEKESVLGGWNGVGCIHCPMTDNRDESKRRWLSPDRGCVQGTEAVVIFNGNSLCYRHFLEAQ